MSFHFHERRKDARVIIRFPAQLRWRDERGKELTEATYTTSISNIGASFVTSRPLPVGEMIHVSLDIGGFSGSSTAEVKWVIFVAEVFEIGVRFE